MTRVVGIAGIQLRPMPYDIEATWAKAERLIRQVKSAWPWVDLALLPELSLHAVAPFTSAPAADWMSDAAEQIPGPTTERAQQLARDLSIWLVPGSIYERAGDAVYNTAVVIDLAGELVGRYRKIFPWEPYERTDAGHEICVFSIPGVGAFGLCICYDMWFPEVCRELFWKGAEVILHPSLTSTWDRGLELVLAQANAVFNQVYFLDVNGANEVGGGRSIFVDPEGTVLYQAEAGEEVFARQIDLAVVDRVRSDGTLGLNRLRASAERLRERVLD